jgi:hypothetical protein
LTADDAFVEYADFYRTAWRARERFVVGLFDQVVSDFGSVITAVNRLYGTQFRPYEATEENRAKAFARVEELNRLECRGEVVETHVGRPSAQRDLRKEQLRADFDRPRTAALLREAEAIYGRYAALAEMPRAGPVGDLPR